jgi:hypothetical protein
MGPVSAGNALVAVDDRPIDGAAGPPHAHTAPKSDARHHEREVDPGDRGAGLLHYRLNFAIANHPRS